MDVSNILEGLNDKQREAVTAPPSNLLVLAGAGSGKTRVLVHRIAWLQCVENVSPFSILAVTFTNKAAASMRGRVEALLESSAQAMWLGTFHGLCHRFLRAHWQDAGLEQNFQVLDSEDQLRLIKRILKELSIDEEYWAPRKVQGFINAKKDAGLRAAQVNTQGDFYTQTMVRIYQVYEEACKRSSLVDFAELLLRVHELWIERPDILQHYQQRFKHILVDEFQDTNAIQYSWLRLLAGQHSQVMIVGDDDQSIYGWRGAKIENIHRFVKDFANPITIRLEQNYRSTNVILSAANAVISNNRDRLGKELWTDGNAGEPIALYAAFNEVDEARFIAERVQHWINQGNRRDEVAVLYRSNAQSRVLEEAFLRLNIPYRVYGGFRFFERAEIKDALAYLRLIAMRSDDAAFERVVNTPTRGLGDRTLSAIRDLARAQTISLWQAAQAAVDEKIVSGKTASSLQTFLQSIDDMATAIAELELHEQIDFVLQASGLMLHHGKDRNEKARARVENLEELISAARQFAPDTHDDMPILSSFLAHAALEAGEEHSSDSLDSVQLMTLHSAKGLEFPLVFIAGVEEGLFPHPMSREEPSQLEEERRLFYVGITRAEKHLCISYAEIRRIHGTEQYHRRSRFIDEIPSQLLEEVRLRTQVSRPISVSTMQTSSSLSSSISGAGLKIGQRVSHAKFGEGVVLNCEGSGPQSRVQIKFNQAGTKWLVEAYAKLEVV